MFKKVVKSQFHYSEELDAPALNFDFMLKVIWKDKLLIIFSVFLFSLFSIVYAVKQPNIYKSEAVLSTVEEQGGSNLDALASQFGGLASMAGINLGSGKSSKAELALEILNSRLFISRFIEKYQISSLLMAVDRWQPESNELIYNPEVFNRETNTWVREVSPPLKVVPSLQEVTGEFKKVFRVFVNKDTGLVSISIHHPSPYLAKEWVDSIINDINDEMRKRDIDEANKSIEFLQSKLESTKLSALREIIYRLIEEQTRIIMFAEIRDEYVFRTIDPAIVEEFSVSPKRFLIVIMGTIFGFLIGVFFVLLRFFRN